MNRVFSVGLLALVRLFVTFFVLMSEVMDGWKVDGMTWFNIFFPCTPLGLFISEKFCGETCCSRPLRSIPKGLFRP